MFDYFFCLWLLKLLAELGKDNIYKGAVSLKIFGLLIAFLTAFLNRYALLGAASFLGGSMRMTVSLCVIMVEITNNLQLLPLIMLVLLISKVNNF